MNVRDWFYSAVAIFSVSVGVRHVLSQRGSMCKVKPKRRRSCGKAAYLLTAWSWFISNSVRHYLTDRETHNKCVKHSNFKPIESKGTHRIEHPSIIVSTLGLYI